MGLNEALERLSRLRHDKTGQISSRTAVGRIHWLHLTAQRILDDRKVLPHLFAIALLLGIRQLLV